MAQIELGQPPGSSGDPLVRLGTAEKSTFPITGDLHQRIAQVVNARFDNSESFLKSRFERFYRYEKILSMISKKKSFEWKSNAYLPYGLAAAESSAAIKFLTLFGGRPWVKVSSRRGGLEDIADHREALLQWRFLGDVGLYETGAEMFRIAERYGKAVARIYPTWDKETLRYRQKVNLPTTLGPIARMIWKTDETRAYRIKFEPCDLTTVYIQPGFKRINGAGGMSWIIYQYYLTIDELKELEQAEMWGPAVGGAPVSEIYDTNQLDMNEYKRRRLFLDKYDDFEHYKDQFDRVIEILEYQGRVPDDLVDPEMAMSEESVGLNPKHRVIAMANRKVIGTNQATQWDHGLKSYVEMSSTPDPYDFYGTGKVEPIEHLVYIGNEIVNTRLDNVKAAMNGLIGVDGGRMPAGWKRRLISQPWGVLETAGNPKEIIQRLQLGDVTASSYQEQQQVFSLIQEATAVNETMLGAPGGAVRTLGEHQMKAEFGGRRLNFELVTGAYELFGHHRNRPGLIHFILSLDRQYLSIPQYLSVINPDVPDDMLMMSVDAQDLAQDDEHFIYTVTGALEGMNRQAKRMEISQLAQTVAPFVQLALMGGFNPIEFLRTLFRSYDLDPDRFFPKMPGSVVNQDSRNMQGGAGAAMTMMSQMMPGAGGGPQRIGQGGGSRGVTGGGQRPEQRQNMGAGMVTPPGIMKGMPQGGGRSGNLQRAV